MFDVIIVGAGPAGLCAGLYCIREGLNTVILERMVAGGQMATTEAIENYPAIDKISGFELAEQMSQQVKNLGGVIKSGDVVAYELDKDVKKVITPKETFEAKAVILAMGAIRRTLGVPGEAEFASKGVSYCATCDGFFFKGRTVAVVGGGDTAVADAEYLANLCEKVYLIHRRDQFRAAPIRVDRIAKNPKVTILYDTVVTSVNGSQTVESISVQNVKSKEESTFPVSGVFMAVGTHPQTDNLQGILNMDQEGYILAGEDCKTSLEGVFVAGDLRKKPLKQIVTALADGAVSAFGAGEYIREK
jgi:thioredoxin reductase (NADPH)